MKHNDIADKLRERVPWLTQRRARRVVNDIVEAMQRAFRNAETPRYTRWKTHFISDTIMANYEGRFSLRWGQERFSKNVYVVRNGDIVSSAPREPYQILPQAKPRIRFAQAALARIQPPSGGQGG